MSKHRLKTSSILIGLVVLLAACSTTPQPTPAQLTTVIASSELVVGENRFLLGLQQGGRLIEDAQVHLKFFFLDDPDPAAQQRVRFETNAQPLVIPPDRHQGQPESSSGTRTLYRAQVNFDAAGSWGVEIEANLPGERVETVRTALEVLEQSSTPAIGEPAPASQNATLEDAGGDLSKITSDVEPHPDLYRLTIAEALRAGVPLVVTFSTPGFCVSRTCGPVIDVVKQVKQDYADRVNFIHVEIYKDFQTFQVADAVYDWRLPSEPWTFVIDAGGKVAAKFEGYLTPQELSAAIEKTLGV